MLVFTVSWYFMIVGGVIYWIEVCYCVFSNELMWGAVHLTWNIGVLNLLLVSLLWVA